MKVLVVTCQFLTGRALFVQDLPDFLATFTQKLRISLEVLERVSILALGKFVHHKTKIILRITWCFQTNIEYSDDCFIVTFCRNSIKISDCRAFTVYWPCISEIVAGCRAYSHSELLSCLKKEISNGLAMVSQSA